MPSGAGPRRAALHPRGNVLRTPSARRPGLRGRRGRARRATRSACRTRRSSARRPAWRSRPRTAASTSTSRRSGCTSTASRSRRAWRCRRSTSGSRWPASAARSAGARTCRSRSTPACSRCARGRPVKMVYGREESFVGHVHRHPARMRYEHGATRDGELLYVRARMLLDGGAYASSSPAVVVERGLASRPAPTRSRTPAIEARVVYTNNPPCGAMRGFGAVQVAVAYEAQMDRLAAALGLDPVELRRAECAAHRRPDADRPAGGRGRRRCGAARAAARHAAAGADGDAAGRHREPARAASANTTHGEGIVRGVGYAIGFKNIGFSEGFDDYSTARVRVSLACRRAAGRGPYRRRRGRSGAVHGARADRAHGARLRQRRRAAGRHRGRIGRLGVRVTSELDDRRCGEAGLRGGARAARATSSDSPSSNAGGGDGRAPPPADVPARPGTGQGDAHVALASPRTGRCATSTPSSGSCAWWRSRRTQDVGKVINRVQCEGQVQGGISQGLGLALMEEIRLQDGVVATRASPTT